MTDTERQAVRVAALRDAVKVIEGLHIWVDDKAGRLVAERAISAIRALALADKPAEPEPTWTAASERRR